jgi:hypothetical protein
VQLLRVSDPWPIPKLLAGRGAPIRRGRPWTGDWDYDTEGVFQFGEFGSRDIRAWTLASIDWPNNFIDGGKNTDFVGVWGAYRF